MKLLATLTALLISVSLFAAELDLTVKNPSIEKLQARMSGREAKVDQWKSSGVIGEESTGLLKQRDAGALGLADKKEVRDLVVAENEDRYAFFREVILAGALKETDLTSVAAVFAKSRRQASAPGHWVENPADRTWVQRKDLKE